MELSTILKRTLGVVLVTLQGLIIGVLLNVLLRVVLYLLLRWGDGAPDWFVEIQGYFQVGLLLVGVVGWAVFYWWLTRYLDRKEQTRSL